MPPNSLRRPLHCAGEVVSTVKDSSNQGLRESRSEAIQQSPQSNESEFASTCHSAIGKSQPRNIRFSTSRRIPRLSASSKRTKLALASNDPRASFRSRILASPAPKRIRVTNCQMAATDFSTLFAPDSRFRCDWARSGPVEQKGAQALLAPIKV